MQAKVVLLVEDDPDDASLIQRALFRLDVAHVVVVARDGAEALHYFSGEAGEQRPLPELVILDLSLPKVDGFEVLAQLRAHERTALLPVVVLTSSQDQQAILSSYVGGANSVVRKPVELPDFLRAVRSLGLCWLMLNEVPAIRG